MSSSHLTTKQFIIGATIGSLLGSISAVLLTPKTGKKMRRDICNFYEDISDKTSDVTDNMLRKSRCLVNSVNCHTSDWTDKAKSLMSEMSSCLSHFGGKNTKQSIVEDHTQDFLIGALGGAIIGAVAGLLLAPKPGKKIQDDILDTYNDISDAAQDFAESAHKKGKRVVKNARKQAHAWLDLAKNLIDEFVEGAEDINENITDKVHHFTDTGREKLNHALDWIGVGLRVWRAFKKK